MALARWLQRLQPSGLPIHKLLLSLQSFAMRDYRSRRAFIYHEATFSRKFDSDRACRVSE